MDISDEMIHRARRTSVDLANLVFIIGEVNDIPWEPNFFSRAISVESSYYWPDPAKGIREIFRVLCEGGSAWILINYYRDNPHCHQWGEKLAVPTHLLSAEEWAAMFRGAGFSDVAHRRIVDPTPAPDVYTGRWFRDAAQLPRLPRHSARCSSTAPSKACSAIRSSAARTLFVFDVYALRARKLRSDRILPHELD